MLENIIFYENESSVTSVGIICLTQSIDSEELEKTFIPFNKSAAGWCDKTWDCQFGGDEAKCNNLAKAAFYPPIYGAAMTIAFGCVLLVSMMIAEKRTKGQEGEKATQVHLGQGSGNPQEQAQGIEMPSEQGVEPKGDLRAPGPCGKSKLLDKS
jgi:hypothetical protein